MKATDLISSDSESRNDVSKRWIGVVCGLLIVATAAIPWGVADEKVFWSASFFNHFYTMLYKVTLGVVWVAGMLEFFAGLKLGGAARSIVYVLAGGVLAFYLSVTKSAPAAWTNFPAFAKSGTWFPVLVIIALFVFILATGVRARAASDATAAVMQKAASALVAALSLYGIVRSALLWKAAGNATEMVVVFAALILCLSGSVMCLTRAADRRRTEIGRLLVLCGCFAPFVGHALEPLFNGDQFVGIFAQLNTEIIIAAMLLIFVEGLIGLSVRYPRALSASSGVLALVVCGLAIQHAPHTAAHRTTASTSANGTAAPTPPPAPPIKRTGDWTQWCGGADRNMAWDEQGLPDHFDGLTSAKTSGLKNVKWVAPLAKRALGSPVIAGGKVFIGGEDIEGSKEIGMLWCFDESTGKLLWRMASPYTPWLYNLHTYGNCATPTVDGNRLYTCNHLGDVLCLSVNGMSGENQGPFQDEAQYFASGRKVEKSEITPEGRHVIETSAGTPATLSPLDADIIWRFDMLREVNAWPFNAINSAVLIRNNSLFVGTGSVRSDEYFKDESWAAKVDAWKAKYKKSDYDSPSLIVLDKATGKLMARDRENIFAETFHGAHASPALATVDGRDLIIYGGGNGTCYAFDPDFTPGSADAPADLKCVWKFNCLNERITRAEIIATPVFYKNRVYVAIGNDLAKSGSMAGPGRLVCIDATQAGDISGSGKVWSYDEIRSSACTVAIADGILYTGDAAGNIYCFDADTGKLFWRHTARHPVWSSPLAVDGKVYFGLHEGGVMVFAQGKEKKLIAENLGNADIISSPAVANGVLYYASQRHLFALKTGENGGLVPAPDAPAPEQAIATPAKP